MYLLAHRSHIEPMMAGIDPHGFIAVETIYIARICPRGVSTAAEAWARLDEAVREIWVAAYSDTYLSAAAGDRDALKKLAAIIVHEQTHLDCGNEAAAYDSE